MNRARLLLIVLPALGLFACDSPPGASPAALEPAAASTGGGGGPQPAPSGKTALATFAGGCFWCMEPPFERMAGVVSVTSGYTGGETKNPTYEQVSAGVTGHAESIQVRYDPTQIGYRDLLDVYWHNIDPTSANAQFCDHGTQYRSAIFFHDDAQKKLAEASRKALEASGRFPGGIVTRIEPLKEFYPAEEYHQDYYKKNPVQYKLYRHGCGRDERLEQLWGPAR